MKVEQTDNKVPFALPWKMVERRYVFAIVDANGDDVTHFSKNLLSYRSIISTDTIKEIDKPVRECAELVVRCCNNHRGTDKYSADEALAIADGLMEGDAMAAAKTLAVQARFYFKEYEALRKTQRPIEKTEPLELPKDLEKMSAAANEYILRGWRFEYWVYGKYIVMSMPNHAPYTMRIYETGEVEKSDMITGRFKKVE